MADDSTRIVISLETILRGLDKTLRGLDQVRKRLDAIGNIKSSTQGAERAVIAAQKLAQQQQRLLIQSQELANKQERARQTTEKLAQSQQRLTLTQQRLDQAQQRVARSAGQQADAHVIAFRALQRGLIDTNHHIRFFRANEAALRKAPQLDAHVKAFRAIQKGAEDANHHVLAFRANERALARAPQMDAHVRAFRAIEDGARKAEREQRRFQQSTLTLEQSLGRIGGSLRNLGLGLTSLGASITVGLSAPLTALGVLSARNAVTLDSLQRGLTAITGSADEAGRQLARLTNIAKLPGIGFQEAIQGSIRLQAVGFSAGVAERALIQFSNAVALTGGGREELARITVQLGQLSAKGKVLAQDLKPIIEAGPAVGRALLQAFGTVNSEDIQALGLSSQQFIDTLLTQLEKLPRAAAGLRNTFDNFSDAVFRASSAIGNAILPVLTRLIEVAEPIITRLADGFSRLPAPVQTLAVAFGALAAASGPALFIMGQFATGIGGLISAFGRLHALGLLPTIEGFRLLRQVMAGTASLAAGQAATTAAAAAGWGALGVAILGVVALGAGIAFLLKQQKDAVKISKEQIAATDAQITSLKDQLEFTNSLKAGVERTADEQERLAQIYADLNTQAKIRLTAITDEEQRLVGLREELQRLLRLRNEERIQQAANLAASLADTAQQLQLGQQERDSIADRVRANVALAAAIAQTSRITAEQSQQLARQGINAATVEDAIGALNSENENLIESQGGLIKSAKELNGTAEEQGQALAVLIRQTGLTARELLSAAKAMGVFKGDVEATLPALERFIEGQQRAATATSSFTRTLAEQSQELLKAGDAAEAAEKGRQNLIRSAVSLAKEASTSFDGALKFMRAFIAAQPELASAIQKELQLQQKSMDEFLNDILGGKGDRGGTALRNAREQLAKAILDVSEAQAEKESQVNREKNEQILDANELSYKLQLRSYREYLEARASFTDANLALESNAAKEQIKSARLSELRLRTLARQSGIPEAERVKREAQATAAREAAIRAETRLAEIESQRTRIAAELKQTLAESAAQQLRDVRQLEIEYAELTGRIEDALNAATDEKFRDSLRELSQEQDHLNKQLERATKARDADLVQQLSTALQLNQRQIEAINNIIRQERATNQLSAANEFVRRAKEKQAELEQQLTFEVEFRGLKEEEAIRRRLEGERALADRLQIVRDLVQDQIDLLNAAGVKPPQALIDFIRETQAAIRGLGELPFSEQFRLVEQEFNRLNDERLRRIADVERAVRERDIAEIEGMLIIRRINGEYTADLERQVELLKQIAAQSNDASLQRQAQAAEQTAKDANSQLASFNQQLRSTSIDALKDGFTDFFVSLRDNTITAKEKLLNLVDSVVARINQVIAENLSEKLIESLFGSGKEGEGILASIGRFFGIGGDKGKGGIADVAGKATGETVAGTALQTGATAAATALTTGGTAAGAALTTGGATASATLVSSLTAAAASFSAAVITAGAAFAAAVAAASASQAVAGGLGGALGGAGAATGLFPAVPGGMYRIVEGGYPEAVITTDPKHAARQVSILRELIARTKGFYGRVQVPDLAIGGIVSRETAEANLLSSISRAPLMTPHLPDAAHATVGGGAMTLRQIFVDDQRDISNWYNSAEGDRVQVQWLARNRPTVQKLLGIGVKR